MATTLLYMDDFDVTECIAKIEKMELTEDDRTAIILDQTCFYPRGGGQDWDTGTIKGTSGAFNVEEVRLNKVGVVWHIGDGDMRVGDEVTCSVSKSRRSINTRLHSGGHSIDMAVCALYPQWIPQKGAHYPHMSFVEYGAGVADEAALATIQQFVNTLLLEGTTNTLCFVNKAELAKLCRHIPENIPENKPTRVVMYGDFGVPCGGTHVKNLKDIGKIVVTKVETKKGITKVGYCIEGIN